MSETKPVALIGGITGSIGSALAHRLHKQGWTVEGFARGNLSADLPSEVRVHEADSLDPDAVAGVFEKLLESRGRIDAYVHAIGSIKIKPLHTMTDEEWRDTIDRNLTSVFYALRPCFKIMNKQGSGAVALLSSVAAVTGLPAHEAISAAKAGVAGLIRSAAASYVSRGIRINGLAPGLVESNLSQPFLASGQARSISEQMHPMGRIGTPSEIASLLAWLVSEEASWVTGQVWSIDGGMGGLKQRPKA